MNQGKHEVVAVCVDSKNNGDRLSQTFIVTVNYTKTKSVKIEVSDEAFVGAMFHSHTNQSLQMVMKEMIDSQYQFF